MWGNTIAASGREGGQNDPVRCWGTAGEPFSLAEVWSRGAEWSNGDHSSTGRVARCDFSQRNLLDGRSRMNRFLAVTW